MSENRRRGRPRGRPARAAEGAVRRGAAAAHRPRPEPPGLAGRGAAPQAPLAEATSPFARFDPIAASDADDVVLPDGFTYDVVLKWGDVFTASGRPFGYNNDYIGVFALGGPEEALLVVNHEYVSLAYAGDAALYPQTFEMLHGRKPTVADYKTDVGRVGGARAARRRQRGLGAGARRPAEPPDRRPHAVPLRRAGVAAHRPGGHRRDVRQLLGPGDAVGDRALLRGELPGPRAGAGGREGALGARRQLRPPGRPLRVGGRGRSLRSGLDARQAHRARPLPPRERRAARGGGQAAGRLHGRRPHPRPRVEVRLPRPVPPGRQREQPDAAVLGHPVRRAVQSRRHRRVAAADPRLAPRPQPRAGGREAVHPAARADARRLLREPRRHRHRRLPGGERGRRDAHRAARGARGASDRRLGVRRVHGRGGGGRDVGEHLRPGLAARGGEGRRAVAAVPLDALRGGRARRSREGRPASSRSRTTSRSTPAATCGSPATSRARSSTSARTTACSRTAASSGSR